MRRTAAVVFLTVFLAGGLFAQQVLDLGDLINNRQVSLSARGNGSSSGASLDGDLRNLTAGTLRINTVIRRGLFLANSGAGQNMAATGVYLGDLGYYSDGKDTFIELGRGAEISVCFIGFCVDFQKENPSAINTWKLLRPTPRLQAKNQISARLTKLSRPGKAIN